ncbi:formate/nitrite transporter family protein [Tessaracoccus palaemonis]|uniref:Formate/nitrite transporter family protein n=1 Tax=Tessaracoccus palaemonis TaxID=2829499 RepID=A0ABX8SL76_9ACTN|nr:formate/nitrite transporter family protein [Tessaracoccus palaemonis]QXT64117.1 formate/nitrite transporter family protein [Tessaracoccus palaemonis]
MSDTRLFPGQVFIQTVLDAAETKDTMSRRIKGPYLMRAAMAGLLIGILYVAHYQIVATFTDLGGVDLSGVGKILGAAVFGWALVFIYLTKSELLTSNMMLTSVAVYHRRITPARQFGILSLCLLGNALGGLALALMLKGSTIITGGLLEAMQHAVDVKLGYTTSMLGLSDLFFRAVLCNLLINIAMLVVYNGYLKDYLAIIISMLSAVFLFVFLGLEHSVANTVLFLVVGLQGEVAWGAAALNVAVALLGNFVGGGVLIGFYYAFLNDPRRGRTTD